MKYSSNLVNDLYGLLKGESLAGIGTLDHSQCLSDMTASLPIPMEYLNAPIDAIKLQIDDIIQADIKPAEIHIHSDNISFIWYPKEYLMLTDHYAVLNLVIEFAEFLNKFGMPDLKIDLDFYANSREINQNGMHLRNYDIHFNKEYFNFLRETAIYDWRE